MIPSGQVLCLRGGVNLPNEHRTLIENLTDCGIINSICSKNDYDSTVEELKKLEIWDHFVFASINWENKGIRIKNIIDQMALRPVNVLFLDDNTFNIKEDAEWTDKTPLTSYDFKFGLTRGLDPETKSPAAATLSAITDPHPLDS